MPVNANLNAVTAGIRTCRCRARERHDHADEVGVMLPQAELSHRNRRGGAAEAAIARARLRPGFRDEPDCFMIDGFTIGEDLWVEGFVSEPIEAD